jgi:tryptophan synthase alpha chain
LATTLSESRLEPTWAVLKSGGRSALIPYLTAGFPTTDASEAALRSAAEVSDIIEVGVPFSDPLADGPTIQRSTFEALRQGMTLAGTLELIARTHLSVPVVIFSYLNPILQYGLDRFLADADGLGVAGLILTDLPAGSDAGVEATVQRSRLDLIRLIAPTTREPRLGQAMKGAQGFVYLVARLGVTGATSSIDADLASSVERVRRATALPVAVGFGISSPAQARVVAGMADGVVVGSALVDILGRDGVGAARRFLGSLRLALDERVMA